MTEKAYAKINLGLDVIRQRSDGYHEVKMIMQTVGIYDELEISRKPGEITLSVDHAKVPSDENNLVYQAAKRMQEKYGLTEGVHIHLKKNIPMAAGMAGGSSDAAATLRGMNALFGIGASVEELQRLSVAIGADVPYCILGGTVLCQGIGEELTSLPEAPNCTVLIAKPDLSISTKYVYEHLGANQLTWHPDIDGMTEAIRNGSLNGVVKRLGNVLETVTEREYPVISKIKEVMQATGAMGALMSGSGPTVFGLYETKENAEKGYEAVKKTGFARDLFITEFISPNQG